MSKGLAAKVYPEVDYAIISIEFLIDHIDSSRADIMISPCKDGEEYGYYAIELPYNEIDKLINLALESYE